MFLFPSSAYRFQAEPARFEPNSGVRAKIKGLKQEHCTSEEIKALAHITQTYPYGLGQ